ncbi:MAG TPA: PLP-dependent aspartate aminotransferase family protein [Jatrophihabitans sp.]|nr:PLP-dependent aspartate aminotransferase family protein [Jatrophihabitans sp.]
MSGDSTRSVHADDELRSGSSVAPPIMQSVTFSASSDAEFSSIATASRPPEFYTRYGNPNHAQVAAVLAELEGGEAGLLTASGMGAVSTIALALLAAGDHVIVQRSTYGGTTSLVTGLLHRLGIAYDQVDQTDVAQFAAAMRPTTRLVLLETPSNPLLELTDLAAVSELAHAAGALVAVDNTIATPLNQRPLRHGADIAWHSGTKFLGGHSDVSAGVVVAEADLIDRIWQTSIVTGSTLGPFDAWLLLRGLRTLALRVRQHNANALGLAEALAAHPAVSRVLYPGLAGHPQHALACRQMTGFGGLLSVELHGGQPAAAALLDRLRLAKRAASFGSVSTLVVHPRSMWAGIVDSEQFDGVGISAGLVRISAGIEDCPDLVADFVTALDGLPG